MNLKDKSREIQFPTMQLEDTRYDKNLTGSQYYKDVLCIRMEIGIAFHLLNATLDSR